MDINCSLLFLPTFGVSPCFGSFFADFGSFFGFFVSSSVFGFVFSSSFFDFGFAFSSSFFGIGRRAARPKIPGRDFHEKSDNEGARGETQCCPHRLLRGV